MESGRPYPGARFKKFETVEEAKAFIENSSSGSNTNVYRATTHKTINKTARRHSPDTNASSLRVLSSPSFPHKPRRRNIKKIACEDDVCCPRTVSSDTDNEMDVMENAVHIYTDGACLGNGTASAKAGYGVFFGDSDSRNTCGRLDEREHVPTNQRAELMAILQALKIVRKDRRVVVIHSDSKYSMQCFDSWLPKWRVNGFQTSKNTSVKNLDLIMKIDALIQERGLSKFRFEYVPGHQGDHGNEAADRLARQGVHAEVV